MLGIGLSITKSKATKAASPYQKWPGGYPDSPELTKDYPRQMVVENGWTDSLVITSGQLYISPPNGAIRSTQDSLYYTRTDTGAWVYNSVTLSIWDIFYPNQLGLSNADIYTDNTLTTVAFPKNV